MNIGIMGTGYVGLVHGAVLSSYGFNVTCMDVDEHKIKQLAAGISPIYEPGLEQLIQRGIESGTLSFTSNAQQVVQTSDVIFIAVGTPSKKDGSADLSYVRSVVQTISNHLNGYKVVVCKSTLPIGSSSRIAEQLNGALQASGASFRVDVASNPEFLRQGQAVSDALSPSRIVIGTNSDAAKQMLQRIYATQIERKVPVLYTNAETAEMVKYAANSFLAVKISFINELALLAEKVGANIDDIAEGMGLDSRISPHFLQAGPGYGGSCFPKDTEAVVDIGKRNGEDLLVVQAAIQANKKQKQKMITKIASRLSFNGKLRGRTVAVWGLSFKPDTDDIRDAPSRDIIQGLVDLGATVKVYCPQGMRQARRLWSELNGAIHYCDSEAESAANADAIVLMTEWAQFRNVDLAAIASNMRGNRAMFDLRNMFAMNTDVQQLFSYYGVGTYSEPKVYSLQEAK
ncbi:UDPglucose 6-dehydrogenase [Paenibacillus cellulosilyticus]|uniref:UDP-glucose 6-dehydrogenase n=1 Tax=Paenibacillus cellulosilyticus TaxID=375489 RepID=A0A2V2YGX3_9BACL|nr:UDP-glucose/GDP-mannose dehydrogenase family protein [Paenibacillus cellulosilyticus]PWV92055.1 UDPglucose 6-dehydrogenase [Paenibacillus cellulosilyticus]QKS46736.1 UDP-glucose/GDP-mannose dehydrogenase family protein [Paenibacillus cellulosilyticus]